MKQIFSYIALLWFRFITYIKIKIGIMSFHNLIKRGIEDIFYKEKSTYTIFSKSLLTVSEIKDEDFKSGEFELKITIAIQGVYTLSINRNVALNIFTSTPILSIINSPLIINDSDNFNFINELSNEQINLKNVINDDFIEKLYAQYKQTNKW